MDPELTNTTVDLSLQCLPSLSDHFGIPVLRVLVYVIVKHT